MINHPNFRGNVNYMFTCCNLSVLEGIKIPVMIVLGDRDAVTLEHGIEMYHLIKGSQFCVLPNTTHHLFYERPELINEIAIRFF
jgi:pimeloyl-ACP methyl ester carboxylesterase